MAIGGESRRVVRREENKAAASAALTPSAKAEVGIEATREIYGTPQLKAGPIYQVVKLPRNEERLVWNCSFE